MVFVALSSNTPTARVSSTLHVVQGYHVRQVLQPKLLPRYSQLALGSTCAFHQAQPTFTNRRHASQQQVAFPLVLLFLSAILSSIAFGCYPLLIFHKFIITLFFYALLKQFHKYFHKEFSEIVIFFSIWLCNRVFGRMIVKLWRKFLFHKVF